MNFKNLKYKTITISLIAAMLFSGCKDFLERDVEDGFSTESVTTKDQFLNLTAALYGGRLWADYNAKFSWCVNDGLAGNLYNVFDEEGAIFLGDVAATNTVLEKGYTSLYGVISAANSIINNKILDDESISWGKEIKAEAQMFRGMCYFLLTEYFGEVPLVWDNAKNIQNNIRVPKANRATLYKAIEKDWKDAESYLPDTPVKPGRVTKWSAKGMLAKLYLTMASCQGTPVSCPYVCEDPDYYYGQVEILTTDVIDNSGALLVTYKNIFDFNQRKSCSESLFALYYEDGEYGAASQYQCQLAKNDFWSPAAGWGTGKSLTWTLYKSYANGDLRKSEVCMYAGGGEKVNVGGTDYILYLNHQGLYETEKRGSKEFPKPYGREELAASYVLNNVKKYVYGYRSTVDKMSCPMRLDFLRLADVYLMRAEAKMAKGKTDVKTPSSAGISDLNAVLNAHAGIPYSGESIAFYTPVALGKETYSYIDENPDNLISATVDVDSYGNTERTDFIQERRKEFAMEGQSWLDVKRLFYRNPQAAKDFFKEQDRGWTRNQKYNAEGLGLNLATEDAYVRLKVYNELITKFPEIGEKVGSKEPEISPALANGNFDTWFLPLPARVATEIPGGAGRDFTSEIENGTYPY